MGDPRIDWRVAGGWAAGGLGFYGALQLIWPIPFGVAVEGVVLGSLGALLAFGLALVYQANRVINFAQADMGAVPAIVAVTLVVHDHWPFFVAVPLAVMMSAALGAIIERLVIRPFAKAPRLILMVATIGISQALAGVGTALPFLLNGPATNEELPSPFQASFSIGPEIFHANDILALLSVPAAVAALFYFLRRTALGSAIRAAADNADRAGLLGINVPRTQLIVWTMASALSGVAVIMRAGIVGIPVGSAFGPELILPALAALIIGRMERYAVMFAAATAFGLLEVAVVWRESSDVLLYPALFVIVVAFLLIQRGRQESRTQDQALSSWRSVARVRAIPAELAGLPEVRWGRRLLGVLLIVGAVALPYGLDPAHTNLAGALMIYCIVALSLVMLVGWAGEMSLGQMAFVGVGAGVTATLNAHYHWDLVACVTVSGLAGSVAALIVGLPALRLRGLHLAVVTLAFSVVTYEYLLDRTYFHFLPDNLTQRVVRLPLFGRTNVGGERAFYFVCLATLVIALWSTARLSRTRTRRALVGARDNQRNAQSLGLDIVRLRLSAFALAGFVAAAAGGLFAVQQEALGQQVFDPTESLRALTMAVIGGLGSLPGAVIGATFVKATQWFDTIVPSSYRTMFSFAGSGVGLVLVLRFLPDGLADLMIFKPRDALLRWVALRRGIIVPSLVTDRGEGRAVRPDGRFWWNTGRPSSILLRHPRLAAIALRGKGRNPIRAVRIGAGISLVFSVASVVQNGSQTSSNPLLALPLAFLRLGGLCGLWYQAASLYHLIRHPEMFQSRLDFLHRVIDGRQATDGLTPDVDQPDHVISVRNLDVYYGSVQVLFGVDFDVATGSIVALLGTNGAGKSTLLKAISGLNRAAAGTVVAAGRDVSELPVHEIATGGVVQMPGGRAVFPSLTVRENLRLAAWPFRHDTGRMQTAIEEVFGLFPVLKELADHPAANLSGGQQQMLGLGMAFVVNPAVIMIDELSLGLAPVIIDQLLELVRELNRRGTTIILVEQSVNVALSIAETAFFMEKGEVRFHGQTSELLARPDLLRSVFLRGTGTARSIDKRSGVTSTEVAMSVSSLSKSFAGVKAVNDVSFSVAPGEVLGFVGPNGAGKTTLFDLISGFLAPDSGTITVGSQRVEAWRPHRRVALGLGRSFQDARLFGDLTVTETLQLALDRELGTRDPIAAAMGLPAVTVAENAVLERALELIEQMGLGDYADKFISDLSTGTRRIVDIACQMAVHPSILLFDEPSSGIAQREAEALSEVILGIRDQTGASLLVIEHDMPLLVSVADRLVALDRGGVICQGTCDQVLEDPEVVASYLGTNKAVIERSGQARKKPLQRAGGKR